MVGNKKHDFQGGKQGGKISADLAATWPVPCNKIKTKKNTNRFQFAMSDCDDHSFVEDIMDLGENRDELPSETIDEDNALILSQPNPVDDPQGKNHSRTLRAFS
jgi:hypothetical protein